MQIVHISHPLDPALIARLSPQTMAIGDFDGVHLGHREVIGTAVKRAQERGIGASIMTFHPHPRMVLGQAQYVRMLTPLQDRMEQFAALGINTTYIVEFTREFSQLEPSRFVHDMLVPLQVKTAIVGFDFRFGHLGAGQPDTLRELGHGRFDVEVVPPCHTADGQKISSTLVRELLQACRIGEANALLGRRYRFGGRVVAGDARGRTIGFPTANLRLEEAFILPGNGVYAVKARLQNSWLDGVMNIGVRPTVRQDKPEPSIEVHLFNFNQSIYGETMDVELVSYIRPERKFASLEQLKGQIYADIEQSKTVLM
ncbi:MAG: riboflavin biosynthesis protein RibF [Paenibacillaceae bacterium]|jgi:riboflavin kinase/FMN adenylyltransferase|nr:riboflavin biosynthesis protein RibF [Paenibacillaceae bacterium]